MKVLEEYIQSEQKLARIDSEVDPKLASYLLMSSSFFRAFLEHFLGRPMQPAWPRFAEQLVATVVAKPPQTKQAEKRFASGSRHFGPAAESE